MLEKHHRLEDSFYKSPIAVSFTACIHERKMVLNDNDIFKPLQKILIIELKKWAFECPVYLFMPDHLHLIVQSVNDGTNALYFMKAFKQKSGYWISNSKLCFRWQKDFYDHIIKNDFDIKNQGYYILYNPVRKGLVNYWKDYPFKGSTLYNFDEFD